VSNPPRELPRLELERIDPLQGYLRLIFQNKSIGKDIGGFRLNAEIPGFSSREKGFSSAEKEVQIELPYPQKTSFLIRFYVQYLGVKIPSSAQEFPYSLPENKIHERDDTLVFLRGLGPEVKYRGKNRKVCEKKVSFELNKLSKDNLEMRLYLDTLFQFWSWRWYGKFSQLVSIEVNKSFFEEKELKDGANIIRLLIPQQGLKRNGNIITLKFRYHFWFYSYPLWEVAAFLTKIELSRPGGPPLCLYSSE
jgi:hypothetical protein